MTTAIAAKDLQMSDEEVDEPQSFGECAYAVCRPALNSSWRITMKLIDLGTVSQETKTDVYGLVDGSFVVCPVGTPRAGLTKQLRNPDPNKPENQQIHTCIND